MNEIEQLINKQNNNNVAIRDPKLIPLAKKLVALQLNINEGLKVSDREIEMLDRAIEKLLDDAHAAKSMNDDVAVSEIDIEELRSDLSRAIEESFSRKGK